MGSGEEAEREGQTQADTTHITFITVHCCNCSVSLYCYYFLLCLLYIKLYHSDAWERTLVYT